MGSRTPAVWLSGGLEATTFIALYAVRAFLPIYALSLGVNVMMVGLFFSVQQAVHMLLKPIGGRVGDRLGYLWTICLGMVVLGITLPPLTLAQGSFSLIMLSVFLGVGEALISPSTVALVSTQIDERYLGAGMGLIGTLSNAGKVLGPILGGALIFWLDYRPMFWSMGLLTLFSAVLIWYSTLFAQKAKRKGAPASV
jgi:MFS family permease